jgi:hypothetical protein
MTSGIEARRHLDDARCADLVLGLLEAPRAKKALARAQMPGLRRRLRSHAGQPARRPTGTRASRPRVALHPRRGVPLPTLFAAAAVLVAVAALPLLRTRPHAGDGVAWLPAPGESVRMRGETAPDSRLSAGLAAYEARDLETAQRHLEAAKTEGAAEEVRRLYLGHILVAKGRVQEGAELMGGIRWVLVPEPWRHEGARAWARALRAIGDFARADSVERSLELRANEKP